MRITFRRLIALAAGATLSLAATAQQTLSIGASPVPHAEILEFVKPKLKAEGVELTIRVFTDYVQPNLAVEDGQLDANFFQHRPYLDSFNKDRGTHVVPVKHGVVHVEPFGGYSKRLKRVADLKPGATVAIPNDPSNAGRALLLLQRQGLIKLKDPANILATSRDVAENPKRLVLRELEAAQLPRALDDVDLALINTNYALEARLVPTRDALFIEGSDSPYANFVAARADRADTPALKKLVAALHGADVRQFIATKYQGAVVPARVD